MRMMVVDAGGRGQALAAKLAPECDELFVSPGNPGNEAIAQSTGIATTDIENLIVYAKENNIDLTFPSADAPLALGIVDAFQYSGLKIFGPSRAAAQIEADRSMAKDISGALGIPTGPARVFTDPDAALQYASRQPESAWPLFVKDNELAEGKGAVRCDDIRTVEKVAGSLSKMVIESYVAGPEASLFGITDGDSQITIPFLLRDHKTIGEGDTGPMTGGMGVFAPLPDYTPAEVQALGRTFIEPVISRLGFSGVLFAGLKGAKGDERNLEYNARFGDPETQVIMRMLDDALLPVLEAGTERRIKALNPLHWRLDQSVVCLVLAAEGYPGKPVRGAVIEGLEEAVSTDNVQLLQAATKKQGTNLVTDGGRVINIVATGEDLQSARETAYLAASKIGFGGRSPQIRHDIGVTGRAETTAS